MNIAWDCLPEFEQFALFVHHFAGEHRFMALMNLAYCDESEDVREPPVFSVSGYLARAHDWYELGRLWRIALCEEGLENYGFHMSKCEAGAEAPYQVDRSRRDHLQRRFIDIINATPLWGYAVAIEIEPYKEIAEQVRAKRGDYWKPYYLAFQHAVMRMAEVLDRGGFPKGECIAFVFDQQKEYEGRAKTLYESLKRSGDLRSVNRLGSLTFDDRFTTQQLQAADILAYESMRHFRQLKLKGQQQVRWQFDLLRSVRTAAQLEIRYFGRDQINKLAKKVGWLD